MTKIDTESPRELRQRAEEKVGLEEAPPLQPPSPEEAQILLNELRVHQIELEMQVEELRDKQSELDASRARYLNLYDLAPVGYLTINERGLILEANLTVANMLGVVRSVLLQNVLSKFIFIQDQDAYFLHRRRHIETGDEQDWEMRMVRADGSIFWAHLQMITPADNDFCLITFTDITARKATEEVLKIQKWRLDGIIEGTHVGTWEWNVQTGDVIFNELWAQMIGYTLDELAPISIKTWATFAHPDDIKQSAELLERHFAGELPFYDCECRMKHKDGHWIWVLDRGRVFTRTDVGQPLWMFGTHTDITEQKQAEQNKSKLEALTWQFQKYKSLGVMAGAIAHIFNNQLGVVMGNLEMALEDCSQDAATVKSLAAAMQGASKAAEVSGQMLTYLGQTTGIHTPLDLSESCRQSLPLIKATIPQSITLQADLPSPGPTISANANEILQVLTNLVTNAWEAIDKNPGTIGLTVKLVSPVDISAAHCFPSGWQPQDVTYTCLEVTDTGCGIAGEDIDKVFDPFFSTKFTGRGLGLPVVLGIVKAHNGAVTVESDMGRGSSFRVFFPVSKEEIARLPVQTAQALAREGGGTVLLVDDLEILREVTTTMLTRLGYTVIAAKDGVEAVEIFTQHQDEIRCVLSDLTMPRMDGWQTLAALRKLSPGIPVILSSGHDESRVLSGYHPERPQVFLRKPYQKSELQAAIEKAMGG